MAGHLIKRSLVLAGHSTSVALEPEFWAVLDVMAAERGLPFSRLIEAIDRTRETDRPLASALRIAALEKEIRGSGGLETG
jgi:predicted DNA-binding ribbon-helix-helix protein